jgi:acyl carrier protein
MSSCIPQGIEVLVKKASVDPQFRELLLNERASAAARIGLELEPAEAMMLAAVPREQLEAIIAQTVVPTEHRRAFLGQAAAAMLATVGVLAAASEAVAQQGSRPDPGPVPPTRGIQPDRPAGALSGTFGNQPDRPPGTPTPDATKDERVESFVASEVRRIIAGQLKVDVAEVTDGKSLLGDLMAQPTAMARLRRELEKAFGVKIPSTAWKTMRTVGTTIQCVEAAVKARDTAAAESGQGLQPLPSSDPPARPFELTFGMRPNRALGGIRPDRP